MWLKQLTRKRLPYEHGEAQPGEPYWKQPETSLCCFLWYRSDDHAEDDFLLLNESNRALLQSHMPGDAGQVLLEIQFNALNVVNDQTVNQTY